MPEDNKDDAQEGLKKLLDKHSNDAMALAAQLHTDNFQLREQKRALRAQLDAAEKLKPAEGSTVLSKAETERWEAYKLLGKPDDLTVLRTERDELKAKVAKAEHTEVLRQVAEVEGFDVEVLGSLVAEGQTFEIKTITKDGKEIKQANVVIESDGRKESKPLAEFAQEKWAKFMPALKPDARPQGISYVPQKKGAPPVPPDDPIEKRLQVRQQSRAVNPNPLMPKPAATK